MNINNKKEEFVSQFNNINQQINELLTLREQVRGKLMLIESLEKEEKDTKEKK